MSLFLQSSFIWSEKYSMGSESSTPVEQAQTVKTETHQDAVEIRFDHMAFGGTVALVIIIELLIYLLRMRKKLTHHGCHTRQETKRTETSTATAGDNNKTLPMMPMVQNPWAQPYLMPPAPYMTTPAPYMTPASYMAPDPALLRLERMRQQAEIVDTNQRFTELPAPRRQARMPAGNPIGHSLPSPNASLQSKPEQSK